MEYQTNIISNFLYTLLSTPVDKLKLLAPAILIHPLSLPVMLQTLFYEQQETLLL